MFESEGWLSIISSIGMAVGPPLVYADQAFSIIKKKDSTGFSRDVCAILLIANITRCFFWLGDPFELALLIQSILMIIAQLGLLYICILYRPKASPENLGTSGRPYSFWQWNSYTQYLEFLAGLILLEAILFLIFGRSETYVFIIGFLALGMESTLPIPQLISNQKRRSLYGFRMSTLLGWLGGDTYKAVYFFLKHSPLQFKVCAIFQLSVDIAIVCQRLIFGNKPPPTVLDDGEDLEQALALAEE
ncbi:pq loop repeat protein [Moniliophthora roreri MCA 2997]|uniref:Pq loop repeat protein n=1 Tax=Moniliophthora roreri (strain MCA 2997) TaxID=1381753 RepID=V2XEX3_MONRO|nr:pq loop repeat protein [Moniliophthora roreri MCA 2997]